MMNRSPLAFIFIPRLAVTLSELFLFYKMQSHFVARPNSVEKEVARTQKACIKKKRTADRRIGKDSLVGTPCDVVKSFFITICLIFSRGASEKWVRDEEKNARWRSALKSGRPCK